MRKFHFILTGLLLMVCLLPGQERAIVFDSTYLPAVEAARKTIPAYMKQNQIPGLSITIAKDGELIWSEGFGVLDVESNAPVTVNSMFRVGSVFKSVTATALLKLVKERKIGLDDRIMKYLPNLPSHYKGVTVRQLATHTAGIRHYKQIREFYAGIQQYGSLQASLEMNPEFQAEILSNKQYNSIEESLQAFINDKLLFKPGRDYRYSTYSYVLLGAVIEKAAGKPFIDFVKEEVLDPLKMDHIKPDINSDADPNKAKPYMIAEDVQPIPEVNLSNKWSGGGYVSSTLDIAKFANGFKD